MPFSRGGIHAEELDPTSGLIETELAAAHLAEHEADEAAADIGDLRRVRVAPDVVGDALLPDLRPVEAGDPLVHAADALDVELGHRPDFQVGHRSGVYRRVATKLRDTSEEPAAEGGLFTRRGRFLRRPVRQDGEPGRRTAPLRAR